MGEFIFIAIHRMMDVQVLGTGLKMCEKVLSTMAFADFFFTFAQSALLMLPINDLDRFFSCAGNHTLIHIEKKGDFYL